MKNLLKETLGADSKVKINLVISHLKEKQIKKEHAISFKNDAPCKFYRVNNMACIMFNKMPSRLISINEQYEFK